VYNEQVDFKAGS